MSQPEDDPRDDAPSWPCRKCNGSGRLVAGMDGNHGVVIMVCPRCNGALSDPDPETPIDAELWAAINEYAASCGGDTSAATISSRRMDAVAAVGRAVLKFAENQP